MLYVGLDCHKRYTRLNAINDKESHPCFGGPRPNGQDIAEENWYNASWNSKGKETQNSKKASLTSVAIPSWRARNLCMVVLQLWPAVAGSVMRS